MMTCHSKLPKPKTQLTELLYLLIKRYKISRLELLRDTGMLNPTARIADLRNKHNLDVSCNSINVANKFGRKVKYGEWYVSDKEKAINLYLKINK